MTNERCFNEIREIRVQVRDMKEGDVLVPTERTIKNVWLGRTTGKRTVDLVDRNGKRYHTTFGAYTEVTVRRTFHL